MIAVHVGDHVEVREVIAQEASGDSTNVQDDNDRRDQAERCDRSVDAPVGERREGSSQEIRPLMIERLALA
jgi:hypothetical protein